ncbi:DUF6011 domain-containing protein [Hymenobacter sp. IS2118]|uniref:DUF6011 domain-containing protein n=1 Tax=Hymenobacter sp. IS2118 TaxID=1505605 RepID=UPI001268E92B|nr:DUF6011 domain-containing protein [Hymenobacter sp. IS2118]
MIKNAEEILAEISLLRTAIRASNTSAEARPHRKRIVQLRKELDVIPGKEVHKPRAPSNKTSSSPEEEASRRHEKEMAEVSRLGAAIAASKTKVEAQKYRDILQKKIDKLEEKIKASEAQSRAMMAEVRAFNAEDRLRRKTFNPFTKHLKDADKSAINNSSLDSIKRINVLIFEKNLFTEPVTTVEFANKNLPSFFTHQQASNLCGKMADPIARDIATKFNHDSQQTYNLHFLANQALEYYGGHVITFLLGLRKFELHKKITSIKVPTNYHITSASIDFPTITLTAAHKEKYTIVFHLQEGELANSTSKVRIYSKSLANRIGSVNEQGRFIQNIDGAKPFAILFCEFVRGRKMIEFSSGVETGSCFACGKTLTNSISIKYGIGPICLQNMGGSV